MNILDALRNASDTAGGALVPLPAAELHKLADRLAGKRGRGRPGDDPRNRALTYWLARMEGASRKEAVIKARGDSAVSADSIAKYARQHKAWAFDIAELLVEREKIDGMQRWIEKKSKKS